MLIRVLAVVLLAAALSSGAQAPVPELKVEAIDGGSVLRVRNNWSQALVAYVIELVGYPGSSYSLWRDEAMKPIPPGEELRIQIVNMTVGAAPEYVKLQAAVYADGTMSGIPEKAAQIVERRRFVLDTTRKLIERLDKASAAGTPKSDVILELKHWSDSLPPTGRPKRGSQEAINQTAGHELITEICGKLNTVSMQDTLAGLRASESATAQSKPAL